MAQEEEVLFPAYDSKLEFSVARLPSVSTQELYGEHSIIVEKIRKLAKCIHDEDADSVINRAASLELLLLEHNEKEEQIFLPYASRLLFEDRDKLEKKLEEFSLSEKSRDWGI